MEVYETQKQGLPAFIWMNLRHNQQPMKWLRLLELDDLMHKLLTNLSCCFLHQGCVLLRDGRWTLGTNFVKGAEGQGQGRYPVAQGQ